MRKYRENYGNCKSQARSKFLAGECCMVPYRARGFLQIDIETPAAVLHAMMTVRI